MLAIAGAIDAVFAPRILKRSWEQEVKRFWSEVAVVEKAPAGYGVALDGRPVRTPARAELVVPTRALAEAIADEWRAAARRSTRARCR